ncbi:MAG: T9SS type A sorting domain-containing protein [Bacteroidetes bacterium]|nr:T9SS type A sorting domain-containing protein [Bacteroidota bacterium]
MRKLFLPLISILIAKMAFAQTVVSLQTVNPLPAALNESSGLVYIGNGIMVSHNDGGPDNALYLIDTFANLVNTVYLNNVSNLDWEEVCTDDSGNVYIGDFGNNFNNRTDLRIIKIPNPSLAINDTLDGEFIYFNYNDQAQFPPPDSLLNYDCEAFIWKDDSLFLFTKNRTMPFDGYSRCYTLPDDSGTYFATYNNKFYCGPGPKEAYWITGSTIDFASGEVVLLSSGRCWLFRNYAANDFFGGNTTELDLQNFSQKEGVATTGSRLIFFSDEKIFGFGGNLYKTDLNAIVASNNELIAAQPIFVYSNGNSITIPELEIDLPAHLSLIDVNGKLIRLELITQWPLSFNISNLSPGLYMMRISSASAVQNFKFIK